ncbi:MAG: integrase family protein [Rickettsiales bacterium]|jgi:integrase|nr:integrase family protein [Rickettsiales bacterium]
MAHQFDFSPHIIDFLNPPDAGFDVVQDVIEPRLRLYVTARGVKTFFTRRRVGGRDVRVIIGRYPDVDIDAARKFILNHKPATSHQPPTTFGRLANKYLRDKVRREPKSKDKLKRAIARHFAPIKNKRADMITTAELQKLIDGIAKNSGAATANRMRDVLVGVFKMDDVLWTMDDGNPAKGIKKYPENRRVSKLTATGVRKFLRAASRVQNPILAAAFQMLVFGFAPRSKIFSMRWDDINFNSDMWGDVPLTDAAVVTLRELPQTSRWVFPGNWRTPLTDPRTSWQRLVYASGMPDLQMGDICKFMSRRAEWSADVETLRANRNRAVEEIKS